MLKKILIGVGVALAVPIFACVAFFVSVDTTCDGDDPEALFARSLPRERLEKLFRDVAARAPWDWPTERLSEGEIAAEFADLKARLLRLWGPGHVAFRLRGCMDHHLDLHVLGANSQDPAEQRIELHYGEWPPQSEVLWTP